MSEKKTNKKKKVVKTVTTKSAVKPTASKLSKGGSRNVRTKNVVTEELLFGRKNYILMASGLALIILGYLLMSGGGMEDPNTWDESRIYGFRRITLAPAVILLGLVLEIVAIFKR